MLYYVMLCYDILRYTMLCCFRLHHLILVILYFAILGYIIDPSEGE